MVCFMLVFLTENWNYAILEWTGKTERIYDIIFKVVELVS